MLHITLQDFRDSSYRQGNPLLGIEAFEIYWQSLFLRVIHRWADKPWVSHRDERVT